MDTSTIREFTPPSREKITATFEVKRHTPGEASVFGKDSLTASLSGLAGEKNFLLEAPGKVFSITGNWLEE